MPGTIPPCTDSGRLRAFCLQMKDKDDKEDYRALKNVATSLVAFLSLRSPKSLAALRSDLKSLESVLEGREKLRTAYPVVLINIRQSVLSLDSAYGMCQRLEPVIAELFGLRRSTPMSAV